MKDLKDRILFHQQDILQGSFNEKNKDNWELNRYMQFRNNILDEEKKYPCLFAVEAEKLGNNRYIFLNSPYDEKELLKLRDGLYQYIQTYESISKRNALIVFFKSEVEQLPSEDYKKSFWHVLQFLADNDPIPRPSESSFDPDDPRWSFCFGGETVFIVCRAPFYTDRLSRNSEGGLEITIQPRGTFEDIGGDTSQGKAVRKIIRERILEYDKILPHSDLRDYGDRENREWKQFMLPDVNWESVMKCPIKFNK